MLSISVLMGPARVILECSHRLNALMDVQHGLEEQKELGGNGGCPTKRRNKFSWEESAEIKSNIQEGRGHCPRET
jgi:hypothetical protein